MNKLPRRTALMFVLACSAGAVLAQPASAPGPGMRSGMGPGHGGMGPRFGSGVTPGWSLMTAEERTAHRTAMQGMKSADECRTYVQKHHEEMQQRAKERGQAMPGPRRDVCAGLKP